MKRISAFAAGLLTQSSAKNSVRVGTVFGPLLDLSEKEKLGGGVTLTIMATAARRGSVRRCGEIRDEKQRR